MISRGGGKASATGPTSRSGSTPRTTTCSFPGRGSPRPRTTPHRSMSTRPSSPTSRGGSRRARANCPSSEEAGLLVFGVEGGEGAGVGGGIPDVHRAAAGALGPVGEIGGGGGGGELGGHPGPWGQCQVRGQPTLGGRGGLPRGRSPGDCRCQPGRRRRPGCRCRARSLCPAAGRRWARGGPGRSLPGPARAARAGRHRGHGRPGARAGGWAGASGRRGGRHAAGPYAGDPRARDPRARDSPAPVLNARVPRPGPGLGSRSGRADRGAGWQGLDPAGAGYSVRLAAGAARVGHAAPRRCMRPVAAQGGEAAGDGGREAMILRTRPRPACVGRVLRPGHVPGARGAHPPLPGMSRQQRDDQ